jgi:hypothetical protein
MFSVFLKSRIHFWKTFRDFYHRMSINYFLFYSMVTERFYKKPIRGTEKIYLYAIIYNDLLDILNIVAKLYHNKLWQYNAHSTLSGENP